jgi:hypothetical protein
MLARRLILVIGVAFLGLSSSWLIATAEEQPTKPTRFTAEDVAKMKERFAYQSLADRLTNERRMRDTSAPPLSQEAKAALDACDTPPTNGDEMSIHWFLKFFSMPRVESIQLVHQEAVDEFIKRDGFGRSRVMPAGPAYLVQKKPEPIKFESAAPLSSEHALDKPLSLSAEMPPSTLQKYKLPERPTLLDFHATNQDEFAMYGSFGDVKSVESVAGFEPHRFWNAPGMHDLNRWKIVRLELVSLLKHDTPVVYESEHLPQVSELDDAKTRPLTTFEAGALDTLRAGEELTAQTNGNLIEMVGAIRASNDCMKCHDVPRGTLLGAFSYQLQRDPPIRVSSADD